MSGDMGFDDRAALPPPSPEEGGPKLFQRVVETVPAYGTLIKQTLGEVALEVAQRGGRFTMVGEGPDQGITIELNGQVTRLNPISVRDPEEAALVRSDEAQARGSSDPLDKWMATLRMLVASEGNLRSKNG